MQGKMAVIESLGTNKRGFRNLLLLLLIYLFLSPMLAPYPSLAIIAHSLLSLTLFISVYAIQKRRNYRSYAMILLVPVLAIYWLGLYSFIPFDLLSAYALLALFFLLLIIAFAGQLLHEQEISMQTIFATLCLYLIIGLFWGSLYSLLYELDPGSFSGVLLDEPRATLLTTFNYFSIVTLTTLGYGDITPQTHAAASLCQLEAITGQFYITVLVAWLVGTHVATKMEKKNDRH
jgi:hypothetical protein